MKLPHCYYIESLPLQQCIEKLDRSPEDEVFLAISDTFFCAEEEDHFDETYSQYEEYYYKLVAEISVILGPHEKSLCWYEDDFPDWAFGNHITTWQHNESVFWLRIRHEDRELPILIVLQLHAD